MSAKTNLMSRLGNIEHAISLPALIDNGIGNTPHNGAANLLRKGMGIVAFNILEDYVKERMIEALDYISRSNVPFSRLPDKLKEASTLGAIKALSFRAGLAKKDGSDWLGLVQGESLKVSSTSNQVYAFSQFSFLSGNSNVSHSEIGELMAALTINGGWRTLKTISDDIGGGVPDLQQAYSNAASRRHNAAHVSNFQFEYAWLSSIFNEIMTIAASLDIALSRKCKMISTSPNDDISSHDIMVDRKYRFLFDKDGYYKERKLLQGKTIKNWPLQVASLAQVIANSRAKNEVLVIIGNNNRVRDWHCP
ncbi:HEPN domain-containing protein [Aeromonas hydrophila]|uniref:HEPN domain-containing protein n=1 Tax=Aeromonas hydrophila TaxID=644 RepID=UPI00140FD363|nr:HEPN domain-containing protein [Aeromonas hydrophila]MCO4202048.1 HEPN domain-containing protein [Aeromonas hydrophila]NHT35624.1 hypothetical protein [Aeromonas hydrophila]UNB58842.1 HEPN domain-containing protein [Aeromonas hydrophila]